MNIPETLSDYIRSRLLYTRKVSERDLANFKRKSAKSLTDALHIAKDNVAGIIVFFNEGDYRAYQYAMKLRRDEKLAIIITVSNRDNWFITKGRGLSPVPQMDRLTMSEYLALVPRLRGRWHEDATSTFVSETSTDLNLWFDGVVNINRDYIKNYKPLPDLSSNESLYISREMLARSWNFEANFDATFKHVKLARTRDVAVFDGSKGREIEYDMDVIRAIHVALGQPFDSFVYRYSKNGELAMYLGGVRVATIGKRCV